MVHGGWWMLSTRFGRGIALRRPTPLAGRHARVVAWEGMRNGRTIRAASGRGPMAGEPASSPTPHPGGLGPSRPLFARCRTDAGKIKITAQHAPIGHASKLSRASNPSPCKLPFPLAGLNTRVVRSQSPSRVSPEDSRDVHSFPYSRPDNWSSLDTLNDGYWLPPAARTVGTRTPRGFERNHQAGKKRCRSFDFGQSKTRIVVERRDGF